MFYIIIILLNLTDKTSASSEILTSATITVDGTEVIIDCEFVTESSQSSCVLVYREYGNSTLNVITYYEGDTLFPVSITIDNPRKIYTFAIFGRDGTTNNIDKLPLTSTRVKFKTTPVTSSVNPAPTPNASPKPPGISFCVLVKNNFACEATDCGSMLITSLLLSSYSVL